MANRLVLVRNRIISATNRIANLVRDNRGLSAGIAAGVVLLIMLYGTFVSVLLPKQRMERLETAYDQGDFQTVIEVGRKIVNSDSHNIQAALALAAALLQQAMLDGNVNSVIDEVRGILRGAEVFAEIDGDRSEIQRQLGYTYMVTSEFDRAFEYFTKSVQFDAGNAMAHSNLCYYHDVVHDPKQARAECLTALDYDPKNAPAMIGLVKLLLEEGNVRQARIYAESAILAAQDRIIRAKAYVAAAHVEIVVQNLKPAREYLEKAIKENEREFDALVLYGEISMRELAYVALNGGNPMENELWIPMLQRAAQAMKINSDNYYPYLLFMRAYEIAGNLEAAKLHRDIATRLVKADPTLTELDRQAVLERLSAADNIKLKGIKLIKSADEAPEDARRVYIIQP